MFYTQWLSFEGAVDASLDALFSVLIEDSSTDPTANGILGYMTTQLFGNDLSAWRCRPCFSQTTQTLSRESS